MDTTPKKPDPNQEEEDFSSALSKISLIESILGQDESDIPSEVTFNLPLGNVLALFPKHCVKEITPDVPLKEPVSITMDDLFTQLSKGKATMTVAKLAFFVPSHLLNKEAFSDTTTLVTLPLPTIIQAVGVDKLKAHVAKKVRHYKIDDIDDPFRHIFNRPAGAAPVTAKAEPAAPAPAPVSTPAPAPAPAPTPVAAEQVTEPPAPLTPPTEAAPPARKRSSPQTIPPELRVPEADFRELPGNVNINTASLEELLTLDGVTETMAKRIVDYRTQHGPFTSVFDLVQIPRLSRPLFKRLTGMPFNATQYHRRYKLAQWLHVPVDKVTDFALLTKAVADLPGFSGCMISDKDGLLLAQSKAEAYGENWGAVAIKITTQIRENVQLLNVGDVESISLGIQDNTVTIVASQNVVLTIVHEGRKLTTTHVVIALKILHEVAWLLTRRAYVGR